MIRVVLVATVIFMLVSVPVLAQDRSAILKGSHDTGKVFGRVYTNMGILSAVVPFCENASKDVAPFFHDYKSYMLNKYAPAAGVLIGVHRDLLEKRLGQVMEQSFDTMAKQFRSFAYSSTKQQFLALPPDELERVCLNFQNQINAGEWDVFRLVDEYFLSLKPYVPDFFETSKGAWAIIQKMKNK